MIEASIIFTTIFLITFGLIDVAFLAVAFIEMNHAIDATARCGAVTYEWPTAVTTCPNLIAYAQSKIIVTKNVQFSSVVPSVCGTQPDGQTSYGAKVSASFDYSPLIATTFKRTYSLSICYPLSFTTSAL